MDCPYCGKGSRVLDSRPSGDSVRRRRACNECKRRFTTYERIGPSDIKVLKHSGDSEPFDHSKLARVIARVSRDRALGEAAITRLVRALEAELVDEGTQYIRSSELADRLLARLYELDVVAYRRLAANYIGADERLRTDRSTAPAERPQLRLPGVTDDD